MIIGGGESAHNPYLSLQIPEADSLGYKQGRPSLLFWRDEIFGGYKRPLQYRKNAFSGNSLTKSLAEIVIKKSDTKPYNYGFSKITDARIYKWAGVETLYHLKSLPEKQAQVLFSDPIVIRYGSGVISHNDNNNIEKTPNNSSRNNTDYLTTTTTTATTNNNENNMNNNP